MYVMLERGMVKYPEDWNKSWMANAYKGKGDAATSWLVQGHSESRACNECSGKIFF